MSSKNTLVVADRSNCVAPAPGFSALAKLLGESAGVSNHTTTSTQSLNSTITTQSVVQSTPVGVSNDGNPSTIVVSNDGIDFSTIGNQLGNGWKVSNHLSHSDCIEFEMSCAARNSGRKCALNGVERSKLASNCSSNSNELGALCGAHISEEIQLDFSHGENNASPEVYETYRELISFCVAHGLSGEILSYMLYDEVRLISEMDLDGSGLPGDFNHPIYKYYRLCSAAMARVDNVIVRVPAPEPGCTKLQSSNQVESGSSNQAQSTNPTEPGSNPVQSSNEIGSHIVDDIDEDEGDMRVEEVTVDISELIEGISGMSGVVDVAPEAVVHDSARITELKEIGAKMKNAIEAFEKKVQKLVAEKQYDKVGSIAGSREFIDRIIAAGEFNVDRFSDKDYLVAKHIMADLAKVHAARQEQKQLETGNRLANRALYLPCYTLQFYLKPGTKDYPETKLRWKYEASLDSQGLLTRVAQDLGIPQEQQGTPTMLRLILSDEIQEMIQDEKLSMGPMWEVMRKEHGWVVTASTSSNSYMAWNWNIDHIRNILLKTWPDAIDMGGYNHRLGSPLIPGGYFETTVKFTEIMSYRNMTATEFLLQNGPESPGQERVIPIFKAVAAEKAKKAKTVMIEKPQYPIVEKSIVSNRTTVDSGTSLIEKMMSYGAVLGMFRAEPDTNPFSTYKVINEGIEASTEFDFLHELLSENWTEPVVNMMKINHMAIGSVSARFVARVKRHMTRVGQLLELIGGDVNGLVEKYLNQIDNDEDLETFCEGYTSQKFPKIEISQEVDGSGLYDPDHAEMKALVEKYGPTDFQLSVLGMDGLFAKGIITPRQGINEGAENGGHAIHIDLGQIKGSQKKKRKAGDTQKVYIGIMKSWQTEGTYPGNFEMLQMLQIPGWSKARLDWLEGKERTEAQEAELKDIYYRKARQARFKELLEGLVEEAMEKLLKKGAKGILADLAKGDEHIELAQKMLEKFEQMGQPISPMTVPYLEKFISDRLRKELHVIMQGAGIKSDITPCVVIDAGVKKGTCVISGYKPGETVAIWRYPMVLPQALVTCTVTHPLDHHKVDGKIIRNTLFLNPAEITLGMQGDDDGDICGVSNDPKILELFSYKLDIGVFKIENTPQKMATKTDTDAGYQYIARNNRGPVGATTLMQARLFAAGDIWGAIAMAVLNQEAIDSAKKLFSWSNWELLSQQSSWMLVDGIWHIKPEVLAKSKFKLGSEFPLKELNWWHADRLRKLGIILFSKKDKDGNKVEEEHNPICWRVQSGANGETLKKRVHGPSMNPCRTQKIVLNGKEITVGGKEGNCKARNVVHITHDMTWRSYQNHATSWEAAFKVEGKEAKTTEIRELLPNLLKIGGNQMELCCQSFPEYLKEGGLKERAGLTQFGKDMKKTMGMKGASESEKHTNVQKAQQALDHALSECSPEELATIWYWELTPTYRIAQKNSKGKSLPPIFVHEEVKADNRTIFEANKPNNAFKAVAHPGSIIMKMLGIETKPKCGFTSETMGDGKYSGQSRVKAGVDWLLTKANPWTEMAAVIWKNTSHGDHRSDDAGRIELHSCKDCQQDYADGLLRAWRSIKAKDEEKNIGKLTTGLNKFDVPHSATLTNYIPPTDFASDGAEEGDWENMSFEGNEDGFTGFCPTEYE